MFLGDMVLFSPKKIREVTILETLSQYCKTESREEIISPLSTPPFSCTPSSFSPPADPRLFSLPSCPCASTAEKVPAARTAEKAFVPASLMEIGCWFAGGDRPVCSIAAKVFEDASIVANDGPPPGSACVVPHAGVAACVAPHAGVAACVVPHAGVANCVVPHAGVAA